MVSDDSRTVLVEVPVEWTEVNPSRFNVGPGLSAAPDLEGFTNGYSVPGMFIYATNQMQDSSPDEILDQTIPENYFTDCVNQGRGDFNSREDYSGRFQQLTNCNDAGTIVPIAAIPTDRSFVVRMEIQLVEPRDQEALARIVQSFEVNGPI